MESSDASVDCLPALVRMTARLSSARMSKEPVALDEPGLKRLVADCDEAMVMLLQERAKAQVMLAELKGPGSGPTSAELTGDELDRIERANAACNDSVTPALSIQAVRSVFQEIARGCSQLRCTVAYLGPPATFTHQASRSHFGMNADYVQCDRIPDVFSAVERGKVEWGVAPVENSTEGSVSQTLDLLATTELQVVAEVCLDIRHNLLSHAEIHNVQKVFSHPQALAQSRGWLQTHCPGAQIISESSTARSAELASVAKPEEGVAAVASLLASELYGVAVKAQGIQDLTSNMTRFVIFKQKSSAHVPETQPTGDDKTMLVLCMADRVGALHDVLQAFQHRSVNLARIESRPSRTKIWEYIFFVDVHGHSLDDKVKEVLKDLEALCSSVKVLGSFPFVRQPTHGR